MSFNIYQTIQRNNHKFYCLLEKDISLAGSRGPIFKCLAPILKSATSPQKWHLSSKQIIEALEQEISNTEIIIDLSPKAKVVALYKLRDIWGYTDASWTPIALLLEEISSNQKPESLLEFKQEFSDKEASHSLCGEFLYLQGGYSPTSKWVWGMIGRVNGALLYKEAFEYLTRELSTHLIAG